MPTIDLEELHDQNRFFYSPALAPVVDHPLILERGLPAKKQVLTLYFLGSSRFTDWIEDRIVLPVSINLANADLGLDLKTGLRLDARRCVVDEGYHSLFTSSVEEEVKAASGVEFELSSPPMFIQRLKQLKSKTPTEFLHIIDLGFSIASETLITGTLSTLHRDERVISGVRKVFMDHASDEVRHSFLFGTIFEEMLTQLTDKQKQFLLPLMPDFIRFFTEPDLEYYRAGIKSLDLELTGAEVDQILEESYPQSVIDETVLDAARPSVQILEAKGIFKDSKIRDAFQEKRLLK